MSAKFGLVWLRVFVDQFYIGNREHAEEATLKTCGLSKAKRHILWVVDYVHACLSSRQEHYWRRINRFFKNTISVSNVIHSLRIFNILFFSPYQRFIDAIRTGEMVFF